MDGSDLELFERSVRLATESGTGSSLDQALEKLGWFEALLAEPRAAISILFDLQGFANVCSSALDKVLLNALGSQADAVLLPALGGWSAPGELYGPRLVVRGLATAALVQGGSALAVARTDEKLVGSVVPADSLTRRPIDGIDPAYGLSEVSGSTEPGVGEPADWEAAVALGQLAVGHELVGASRKMLELAREHALNRIQFGQPISRFQAIRHRLADSLVAIETATSILDLAWMDQSSRTAAMAKALAGRSAQLVARHCQQVLAGIGFTTEHPLHRYIRRVFVLDQLLGASSSLTKELGDELVASRELPDLFPL